MKDSERHIFPRMAFSVSAGRLGSRGRMMNYPEEDFLRHIISTGNNEE
jgi:hypothetical protein